MTWAWDGTRVSQLHYGSWLTETVGLLGYKLCCTIFWAGVFAGGQDLVSSLRFHINLDHIKNLFY